MFVCLSCLISSSTNRLSSSVVTVSIRFFFSISFLPIGPPTKLPAIRPNVAAAVQIVVAPEMLKSSRTGPKAPAVPWPPTIGIEPVHKPINGSSPNNFDTPTAKPFWKIISKITSARKIIKDFPPLFKTFKFAWKPTDVKKNTMQTSLKVSSNENSAKPVA